jgi:NitT/TauT family transport system permease protein
VFQHSGVRKLIFYGLLLAAWAGLSSMRFWPPYLFPSPLGVLESLISGLADKSLLIGIGVSAQRIVLGYIVSLVLGITLGVLIGRSKLLEDTLGSLMSGLRTLPSICWLPLAMLWFGMSEMAIQFVVIMGAFIFIAMATEDGIKNIPPLYVRAALTMGTSRWDTIARVVLPAALPSVITGMKLGWAFAWRSLMAGELLFVSAGLGHLLQVGREFNDMSRVVAVMIVIVVIGLVVDKLIFTRLEKFVQERWGTGK